LTLSRRLLYDQLHFVQLDVTSDDSVQRAADTVEHDTPVQLAEAIQNLNELFRAGRAGVIADDIENLTGVAPRSFRDWYERHVDEFRLDKATQT
jgi:hypothetical protein